MNATESRTPEAAAGNVMTPCIITARMAAPCDACGRQARPVHMPRREHGLYCAECCPACSKAQERG